MSRFPLRSFGHWSLRVFVALNVAAFAARATDSVLVFNEIHYHPTDEVTQTEWVELRSLQAVNVDIGGWRIEGDINYTFPIGTVMPGLGYIVVAARPGQIAGAFEPFTGQLDNGGGTIRLVNNNGRLMDELSYDDEGEWPLAPDSSGSTLARVSASAAAGAALWGGSAAISGSPGAANPASPAVTLVFSEISGMGDANFFIELQNRSAGAVSTAGWNFKTSTNITVNLPGQTVMPGEFVSFTAASLAFTPADGMKLFLLAPGGTECRDAREITNRLRALTNKGHWGHPDDPTPGTANVVTVSDAVVINEIFYHGLNGSAEQWIELHNRSAAPVGVGKWKFTDGVNYDIAAGTMIEAGGFLVVAWDPAAFGALHPGIPALGPFSGSLSGSGETITLRDANDNVADQVTYADGGRWSPWADGGGSSLELRDPNADNSKGESWDASDETANSAWQTVSYPGTGANANSGDPANYNEFVFGLLDAGEFLIDDISVKDIPQANAELIQNGAFGGGTTAAWRIIGTHAGTIVDDPAAPGNNVLKISASAATEHMHNHAETTLKNGASYHAIVASTNGTNKYTISFRAKWLRGSNRLHTRLWHNRMARQTLLNRPATGGTPGAANGRRVANIGPTFDALGHAPIVPAATQAATVNIQVADPDGVASVQLFTSINGVAFTSTEMTTAGGGVYTATVTGQSASALVQFYIQASDALGAISFFPAAGAASRAMIPWADGRAQLTLASGAKPHNIRVVLPTADASDLYKHENLMSDAAVPCTVILDESTAYYRAGVRLRSSEHGRITDARCGYTLEFPPDDLFLGLHDTIGIDRSGGTSGGQKEILLKRLENTAGGIIASEDDIVRLISARGVAPPGKFNGANMTGAAILSKTRLDRAFLDAQWPNGGDGSQHKYERVYVLTETITPGPPRTVTAINASNVLTALSEQPKVPQDTTPPPGVAVTSLGSNKENYRWYWLLQNARDTDDFTGIMNVTNAIGQGAGATFNNLASQHINVSAWLRATVPATLYGVQDNYLGTGTGQHNALIHFPPGQKAVLIPWDCDYLAQSNPSTTALETGGDVGKFIANPVWKRLYYAHVLEILNRSFNTTYMDKWATHYSQFGTDNMSTSVASYLTPRAAYARSRVTNQISFVPFAADPHPLPESTPFATVTGKGWVDVTTIRLAGATEPLAVTWTDQNSWTLQLPVSAGTNTFTLEAFDYAGVRVGTTTVTITGEGGIFAAAPGNLIVSELNYHPAADPDDTTEFIELLNITATALDLGGCHFNEELGQGINYTFPSGVTIAAGGRIVIARKRAAFLAAYPGAAGQLAPNQYEPSALDNGGESIVLYSAGGLEILRFTYSDTPDSTDGGGRSLVRLVSSAAPNNATYAWRESIAAGGNPGTTDAVAFSGPVNADLDFDGVAALVEYVCGTSDSVPGVMPFTFTQDALGRWLLIFPRMANADDALLSIESTENLGDPWSPAIATRLSSTLNGTIATETWQITPPASGHFFVRLRATAR